MATTFSPSAPSGSSTRANGPEAIRARISVDQRMEQFNEIRLTTVVIAEARVREHATQFAHGVTVARVIRGGVVEA